jgi:integrase
VAQNVALSVKAAVDKRSEHHQLEVGVDIPKPDEIKHIIAALNQQPPGSRIRPLVLTAIFTGMRASELRGLRWADVDLKNAKVQVKQRADRYNAIGKPKSKAGKRTIPLGPDLVNILREWKLACPKGEAGLVFPTTKGVVGQHSNIVRTLKRVVLAAGLKMPDGKPKYTGLHSLRHFYASWCINRKADGGLELPVKLVQARLGHATLAMTMDRYGHLFPSNDDGAELADAERALMG